MGTQTLAAPAYPYHQFSDDADIVALFEAYNRMAQNTLTWMDDHILPLYMRASITGGLLDYAAWCLYGIRRFQIGYSQLTDITGEIDSTTINQLAIDDDDATRSSGSTFLPDDIFKRVLTWNLYKGDGCQFSIPWLKKRVMRFLTGDQGHAWRFNGTAPVSIVPQGSRIAIILTRNTVSGELIQILNILLQNRIVALPPNFIFTINEEAA